ncbi:MAG: hypothetical protein HY717_01680 [Planctomycetes bacterium]|nr:hypothetical protein [Planctomycetota bacterium]
MRSLELCQDCRSAEALVRCPDGRDRCVGCASAWEAEKLPAWRLGGIRKLEAPLPATSGRMTP